MQEIDAPESKVHFVARRTLQGGCVVTGFVSRIPFVQMNMKLGGANKFYGGVLAYGNCTSFGFLVADSFLQIINAQMDPMTPRERSLKESRLNPCVKKTFFVSSMVLGFVSQIPFAYMTYQYNSSSSDTNNNCISLDSSSTSTPKDGSPDPIAIAMAIMVFAFDSWVYVNSGYQGMRTLRERQTYTDYERQLANVRQRMYGLVDDNLELLTVVGKETRNDLIGIYGRIKEVDNAPDRIKALHCLFSRRISDISLDPPDHAKYVDWVMKSWGFVCAASNLGTLSYMAWLGTQELCNILALEGTVTTIYLGTALYLNKTAIPDTAVKIFNLFKSIFMCNYRPTISDQLTPKLSFCLKGLGLATAALSYGPGVKLSKDYFCFNDDFEVFMEITLSCATVFLVSWSILNVTDKILDKKIEKFGSEEDKQLMQLYKDMKTYSSTLKNSPLIDTAQYLKVLPLETFSGLIDSTDIAVDNLESYIQSHKRPVSGTPLLTEVYV